MKIGKKIFLGYVLIVTLLVVIFFAVLIYSQQKNHNEHIQRISLSMETEFIELLSRDAGMLSSALEAIASNQALKDIFLEKDREKLYNYGQELFQNLKNKYGITHFYFILPDGTNFVRLHNKDIYGDKVTMAAFNKVKATQKPASGIELGQTAFVLRVFTPYYNGNELVGYLELGEEIDHFLEILKKHTGNELLLLGNKENLNRGQWEQVNRSGGKKNTWDELQDYVILGDTKGVSLNAVFESALVKDLEQKMASGKHSIQEIKIGNKIFLRNSFGIKDVDGHSIGMVVYFKDITAEGTRITEYLFLGIFAAILLFLLAALIGFFISQSISKPLLMLNAATSEVGKGDLETKVDIKSSIDEIKLLVGTFNNMLSDLKRTRKMLVQSSKMAVISQLAGNVAHEINNPLTGVLNNVQLIKMEVESNKEFKPDDFKELLVIIEESAMRCKMIIQSLLDLAHASKGKMEPINLNIVVDKACSVVNKETQLCSVSIKKDLQTNLADIQGDPQLLGQVINNLIANAKWAVQKNNSKGSSTITIKTWQDPEQKKVMLAVSDDGVGIPSENLPKLFEPYFSTKGVGEGTGLGLFLINNIIKNHNGEIKVESLVNSGTTFTVNFPVID